METTKKIVLTIIKVVIGVAPIATIVTVIVLMHANKITDTANLIQINNAIQQRTDIVLAIKLKNKEFDLLSKESKTLDTIQSLLLEDELESAIKSLLNTYDFACELYNNKKINRREFKYYYLKLIKDIREENSLYFNPENGKVPYQAINDVYREWYGK